LFDVSAYGAAKKVIGSEARQETGRWLNNRAENFHQPFRRRERAMIKFQSRKPLQKFFSINSSVHYHFNHERHLNSRKIFELKREAAQIEWRLARRIMMLRLFYFAHGHFPLTMPVESKELAKLSQYQFLTQLLRQHQIFDYESKALRQGGLAPV
jgi:hypothetical protein